MLAGDHADDLVTEDAGHAERELAVEQVQIGPAHATGAHLEEQLARAGARDRELGGYERPPGCLEHHGPHGARAGRPPGVHGVIATLATPSRWLEKRS